MSDICLLSLIVDPEAESAVTDWLFEQEDVSGFSSHAIFGHGSSEHAMTIAEQVAGKRRQVLFQMHLASPAAHGLLVAIKQKFAGSGMHYWLQPLTDSGHLA